MVCFAGFHERKQNTGKTISFRDERKNNMKHIFFCNETPSVSPQSLGLSTAKLCSALFNCTRFNFAQISAPLKLAMRSLRCCAQISSLLQSVLRSNQYCAQITTHRSETLPYSLLQGYCLRSSQLIPATTSVSRHCTRPLHLLLMGERFA